MLVVQNTAFLYLGNNVMLHFLLISAYSFAYFCSFLLLILLYLLLILAPRPASSALGAGQVQFH